jgi:prepilin-type N-terminal cleavage/methylation domain-containing protein
VLQHDARRADGFSLVELMVAMTIMLVVTAGVFNLMNPAQGAFQTQPEVADMQQRLRVAADSLYKDVVMAGGGAYQGSMSGALTYFFAPVMPFRQGTIADDPPGTYRDDVITVIYVPPTIAQTSLATKGPALVSAEIGVNKEPNCPPSDDLCGFKEGMIALMYDASGNYDLFEITNVQENALHLQHRNDKLTYTNYEPITTKIVQASYFEYYLKTDNANGVYQLMYYDGTSKPDVPVADNVVGLNFEYFGEPQPPLMKKALSDTTGPWTSYGPKPSAVAIAPYGAGENCIFVNDGSPTPAPRLASLGPAGSGLVKLTAAQLTDGPWCPNDTSANRWDADLLRIRKIGVTVRVQAAVAALRGPASVFFKYGGTSRDYNKWAPDQEVHFEVTPRNLNLGR